MSPVTLYDPTSQDASGHYTSQIIFPISPAAVKTTSAAVIYSFGEVRLGSISRPRGRKEAQYTFSCRLPGQQLSTYPHVDQSAWRDPALILQQLDTWAAAMIVSQRTRLTLVVDGHPSSPNGRINQDVYIGQYDYEWSGGLGDAKLNVTLTEFRPLTVDLNPTPSDTAGSGPTLSDTTDSDPPDPTPGTYTVQPGDSLMLIAQTQLGDMSQWQQVYAANVDTLYAADVANGYGTQDPNNPDPSLIFAGTQLVLPGGDTSGSTA